MSAPGVQRAPRADGEADAPRPIAPGGANARQYEVYFSSGHYDLRYPRPNPTVLRLVERHLPERGHVIDYGCGSGRYLMALRDRAAISAGFDVCTAALARLRENLGRSGGAGTVHLLGPEPADLDRHLQRYGPADVVLCLFGVLSHIEGRAERARTLRRLAAVLRPGNGRLILSVPNRRRRFRREQRALRSQEIRYARRFGDRRVELTYRLFDPQSLRSELLDAGLALDSLVAESLVPESGLATSRLLRAFDGLAAPLVPAVLGYGLLGVARPLPDSADKASDR
jgi:tRNA (uracil-5-)-methyltransferase TRM9